MDPLTHAISGIALARALPGHPLPRSQVILLAGLAMLPDADYILTFISDTIYLRYHRGITHSILMLPLWTWLIYALLGKTRSAIPAWLIAAAIALHIGLDLVTSFGTMILAPFSDWRAALDLVFIIDPLFTACLLLPLIPAMAFHKHMRRLAICAFILAGSYLALTGWAHHRAITIARHAHPDAVSHAALPLPFSPFHWQLIAAWPDHYARTGINLIPSFPGSAPFFPESFVRTYMPPLNTAETLRWQTLPAMQSVAGIAGLPGISFYRWFARFPVLLERDAKHIEFGDLRFGAGVKGAESPFRLYIETGHTPRAWLIWRKGSQSPLP
ncbi:MAG: metal-dependent hydrolase [Mariprofundaceae bacterium]|nr:metal-dependent hydrolase [Mariprofundaceae bacterium]